MWLATLVFRNDNQFETEGVPRSSRVSYKNDQLHPVSPLTRRQRRRRRKGITVKEVVTDDSDCDNLLDPTEACTICFEKAKNAVILMPPLHNCSTTFV